MNPELKLEVTIKLDNGEEFKIENENSHGMHKHMCEKQNEKIQK